MHPADSGPQDEPLGFRANLGQAPSMNHPHALILEKLYRDLAAGNPDAALAECAEACTFQLSGKSRLAGKYDRKTFASQFLVHQKEMSGGTLQTEVHEVMASDRHGMVLTTNRLTRQGKTVEYRSAHIWRFEGGKPVAWYEYPRDMYQYDAIWA